MLEGKVGRFVDLLLRCSCKLLEASSREPFWDIFDCGNGYYQNFFQEPFWMGSVRMGRVSTRNAPGTRAVSKAVIASSDAAKNLSLSDSTFNPYAMDKVNEPVRLPGQIASS